MKLAALVFVIAGALASNGYGQQNRPGPIAAGEKIAVVSTQHGDVRGYIDDDVYAFKGIPYAAADRFMPPRAPEKWNNVRQCTIFAPRAMQRTSTEWGGQGDDEFGFQFSREPQDEKNSLVLNVWTNGINDGKYAYNNLQDYDFTWYHKFNSKWHMATEAWYMYERDVPNVAGNVANPIKPELGANGAFCAAGQLRCTAPEYAIVNYINREVTAKFMFGFRSDLLNDKKGQRTGIVGKYTENTFYLTKYIGTTVMFRPELRFDHSWDREGYNNGTARNQLFFGMDVIYKF